MAGIYLHIPFCLKKCGYCDFYSITDISLKGKFLDAIIQEIHTRKYEFIDEDVSTIYLGGGTPSLLNKKDLSQILNTIFNYINRDVINELTIEVNPDDITEKYLDDLIQLGFNRISIGTQSFNDEILKFMNRRHDSNQAIKSVQKAHNAGFKNISIDLIYGIPNMSIQVWRDTLANAKSMNVQHISAYHLTFESGTPFYKKLKKGEIKEMADSDSIKQYQLLLLEMKHSGFIDYEISNFAQKGFESQHNSSYWTGQNYLGFGPGAHSLKNNVRKWNVSNLSEYISNVIHGEIYFSNETLSDVDRYNELIMLGLRTRKGVDLKYLKQNFSENILSFYNTEYEIQLKKSTVFIENGFLKVNENNKFITDQIISNFFYI